eukprot:scaffold11551_cov144-Cylindrotheca_fusiformis.AAC.1
MRFMLLLLALVPCLSAKATSDEAHRSLDAVGDCYTATTDLVDPVNGTGGLLEFPYYLAANLYICEGTPGSCDFGQPSYINSVEATCTNGKIVTRAVKLCETDLDRITSTPIGGDIYGIHIPFCMATSCPDDVEIVKLHKLLYADGASTGGDNPYGFFVDTLLGNCLEEDPTAPPATTPSDDSGCATEKQGKLGLSLFFALG